MPRKPNFRRRWTEKNPLMPDKKTTFAKNAEGLARAFGLNLSPRKRKASLAIVQGWTNDPSFPKKGKQGWKIAEVEAWRGKREEGRGAGKQPPSPLSALPASDLPATGDPGREPADLFLSPSEALKGRLDLHQERYRHPAAFERTLAKFEIDELRQYRPEIWGGAAKPPEREEGREESGDVKGDGRDGSLSPLSPLPASLPMVGSQVELAAHLARHFAGRLMIDLSEQMISNWKRGENLPDGAPLPPPKIGNRIDAQAWAEWIERHVVPRHGVQVSAQGVLIKDIFARGQEAEAQRKIWEEQIKHAEFKAVSDKYIEVARAESAGAAWARQYHDYWKRRNESIDPAALEQRALDLGVPAATAVALKMFLVEQCQKFLDDVERKCMEACQAWDADLENSKIKNL